MHVGACVNEKPHERSLLYAGSNFFWSRQTHCPLQNLLRGKHVTVQGVYARVCASVAHHPCKPEFPFKRL